MNLIFPFLLAVFEVLTKVWRSPDRLKALKELNSSERFVLALAIALMMVCVKAAIAW